MNLLIAAALLLPQTVTITKSDPDKQHYYNAVNTCKQAQEAIDSDPSDAIDKLTPILDNPKIKKLECQMRVELRSGDVTPVREFYPLQFRGRARLKLGAKGGDKAEALLQGAVDDLKRSVEEFKCEASAPFLDQAKSALAKVRSGSAEDPAEAAYKAVRASIADLVDSRRFKSARDLLEKEGKSLTEARRSELGAQIEKDCKDWLIDQARDFRRRLDDLKSAADIARKSADELAADFPLPSPAELVVSIPEIDWARRQVQALEQLRKTGRPDLAGLLAVAAEAAKLDETGSNPWFSISARFAFSIAEETVSSAVDKAHEADKATRTRLRSDAAAAAKAVRDFEKRFNGSFLERHSFIRQMATALESKLGSFPADLAELDAIDLEGCLASEDPEAALEAVEKSLAGLADRSSIALESRRKLFSALVAAKVLRALLGGRTEAEAADAVRALATPLKAAGGPVDPKRYGPRVEQVFGLLAK